MYISCLAIPDSTQQSLTQEAFTMASPAQLEAF